MLKLFDFPFVIFSKPTIRNNNIKKSAALGRRLERTLILSPKIAASTLAYWMGDVTN